MRVARVCLDQWVCSELAPAFGPVVGAVEFMHCTSHGSIRLQGVSLATEAGTYSPESPRRLPKVTY